MKNSFKSDSFTVKDCRTINKRRWLCSSALFAICAVVPVVPYSHCVEVQVNLFLCKINAITRVLGNCSMELWNVRIIWGSWGEFFMFMRAIRKVWLDFYVLNIEKFFIDVDWSISIANFIFHKVSYWSFTYFVTKNGHIYPLPPVTKLVVKIKEYKYET